MSEYFDASMGAIFVQPDGRNTVSRYLGCHEMGDIAEPRGDITLVRCPDPSAPGKWRTVMKTQAPPDLVTFSIDGLIGKTADWLEGIRCPATVFVKQAECGRKDLFLNYDRYVVLPNAMISNRTQSSLVMREGSDPATQSFEFSGDDVIEVYPLLVSQGSTAETQNLLDITFCNSEVCKSACGPSQALCSYGYIAAASAVGPATANVYHTEDGTTWAVTATDPFAAAEHISAITCFQVSRTASRVIAARGVTDAGNPAEISWSDDEGATWHAVNVGATNAEFVQWNGALFALDMFHIWAGLDSGDLWFSEDSGVTWVQQTSTNVQGINSIHFIDENRGMFVTDAQATSVYYTEDGGTHWTPITGPVAQNAVIALSCWCLDDQSWWVGYADGELWYTDNGGDTWAQRTFTVTGASSVNRINDIKFDTTGIIGFAAIKYTVAAALWGGIMRTFDGGTTWETYSTLAAFTAGALGLSAVEYCGANRAAGVGDISAALGYLMYVND